MNARIIAHYSSLCILSLFVIPLEAIPLIKKLTSQEAREIGKKIWSNESAKSTEYLVFWKEGEEFGSFGIGHVIWHPKKSNAPQFKDTFPLLIKFMQNEEATIPAWIVQACTTGCPWNNRKEFYAAQQSQHMKELKKLMLDTIDLQTKFMITRLESMLKKLPEYFNPRQRAHIEKQIYLLAQTAQGMYALIDYLNFKGEGLGSQEQYQGKGWGLIEVLKQMHATQSGKPALQAFATSAKQVLQTRVKHSPSKRNEAQWLPGWFNRINTYIRE